MTLYRRRMAAQRAHPLCVLAVLAAVLTAIVVYQLMLTDFAPVQSSQELDAFLVGGRWSCFLDVPQWEDTGLRLTMTEARQVEISVPIPGAPPMPGIAAGRPLTTRTTYRVFAAPLADGGTVLVLSRDALPAGRLLVTRRHHADRSAVLAKLDGRWEEPVYMLTAASDTLPAWAMMLGVVLLSLLAMWYSPALDRRSHLGRQLAAAGNYRDAAAQLRRELEAPVLLTTRVALMDHALLVMTRRRTDFLPLRDAESLRVLPPLPEDDDPIWHCVIAARKAEYRFPLYSGDELSLLKSQLHLRCPSCVFQEEAADAAAMEE